MREIAYNDVKVKIGHFYTPIGYEVVPSPQNFFYSHSYSQTFGEPFTHTGFLAAYQPNEKATYYGGWVDGWDEGFEGKDGGSMFLGGVSFNLSEKATLAWYCSAGLLGTGDAFPGAASGDLYYNCFVFTYKLNDKWTYVFEHDLGTNYNVDPRLGVNNQWYQINNYLIHKINDCWSFAGRFEWFQDPQGARVVRRRSRQLLGHDRRIELQAARQRHDPSRNPLRLLRRHARPDRPAVQQRRGQLAALRRFRYDLYLLM